ncbi:hypothetical protein CVT26_009632 [Gymnopilus dilepis]|uniref:G-patch domain-containing protein n=1 Tax=Gymnopilus dilepis TaxID=231916 RepID=A0A409VKT6_9AGAR|nr:hypothetical protein CVT26_009632 [Gymnopilus dilepis]
MAYNREWDRGKDEHYPEAGGKRRKFNNGGYDPSADHYNDWPHDYPTDDRSRAGQGAFPKKRLVPSEPSPHVIFLGLDPDFTEADTEVDSYPASGLLGFKTMQRGDSDNHSRKIIRHLHICISKGFGFAQFTTVDHARAFVDPLFPFIQMPPPASHGASATANFYKAIETGVPHNGRRVKIDYSQSATPHDRGRLNRGNMNDGTRDIGNAQSPVLLFRGLDPLSGPQAIYQALLSSLGPGKDGPKGMRRIILIKDKITMASFGFAFVEFVDISSASTVLAATMSPQLHPSGFRISDRPVAASFAHPYSFQPVTDFLSRDEACLASTLSLGGVEGTWVRYWDESSTVAVLEFKVEEPVQQSLPSKDKKEKKKVKDHTAAQPTVPSALPVSDKPVTLNFSKGPVKANAGAKIPVLGFSMDDSSNAEDMQDDAPSEPNKPMIVKKVAPLIASKKTASNINKWNQVQEELAQESSEHPMVLPQKTLPPAVPSTSSAPRKSPTDTSPVVADTSSSSQSEFEFADVATLTCLLCARQLKSLDQLKRHNKESDLHKVNLKDAKLQDVARQKVASRKAATSQPKYRDRASERRTLFNQPDVPLPDKDAVSVPKKRQLEGPQSTPTPPPPAQDDANVGNKLLKMMGWKEGSGLGSEGDGRVKPIETAVYAPGAGLGASKGKDLGKYAEGFSSYVHMAQDAARERYGA